MDRGGKRVLKTSGPIWVEMMRVIWGLLVEGGLRNSMLFSHIIQAVSYLKPGLKSTSYFHIHI